MIKIEADHQVMARTLYMSENGDRWLLVKDASTGQPFVRHQANEPSGGAVTDITLPIFLISGHGPQHQALWGMIDALVDDDR